MIKQKIENILKDIAGGVVKIEIFASENEAFGHYSTNVALKLAKVRAVDPMKIAEDLKFQISNLKSGFFEKIETAKPGFINFWLSGKVLRNELKEILKKKEKYGKTILRQARGKKIQIEFISANPTGPLTLANGRGGFMGDVLANILEFQGYKIEREYYVNDTGNQILTLGKSVLAASGLIKESASAKTSDFAEATTDESADKDNFYKGGYVKEWAKKHKAVSGKYQDNPLRLGQSVAADFLKGIKSAVKKAKINFNRWTSENKRIHKKSFVKKALAIFEKSGLTYKKDGALWLKTTRFGDEKDRVLITGDNFPTYFLADAGHFLETKSRGFNSKIMILGPDHHGYVGRAAAAAKITGIENFEIIITQAMRLVSKGEEIKMSKRSGEFITFEELLKEAGADATRFFFLTHSAETHMDFDLDLAKERSIKNPVYYVQYAAVRAQSILKRAQFLIFNFPARSRQAIALAGKQFSINFHLLNTKEDLDLMRILARFPEAVSEAGEKRQPQILARYALELAREFHNFYEKERIIGEKPEITAARLVLIQATLIIFKNLLTLLGIGLPKKM